MKGVDELAASSHKTAACTCDIISYVPTINIVNRRDVFVVSRARVFFHFLFVGAEIIF